MSRSNFNASEYQFSDLRPPTNLGGKQGDHVTAYKLIVALGESFANHPNPGTALINLVQAIDFLSEREEVELSSNNQSVQERQDNLDEIVRLNKTYDEKIKELSQHAESIDQEAAKYTKLCLLGRGHDVSGEFIDPAWKEKIKDKINYWADLDKAQRYKALTIEFLNKFVMLANKVPDTAFLKTPSIIPPLNNEGNIIKNSVKELREIDSGIEEDRTLATEQRIAQLLLNLFWYPPVPGTPKTWKTDDANTEEKPGVRHNQLDTLSEVIARHLDIGINCFRNISADQEFAIKIRDCFFNLVLGKGEIIDKKHNADIAVVVGWDLPDNDKQKVIEKVKEVLLNTGCEDLVSVHTEDTPPSKDSSSALSSNKYAATGSKDTPESTQSIEQTIEQPRRSGPDAIRFGSIFESEDSLHSGSNVSSHDVDQGKSVPSNVVEASSSHSTPLSTQAGSRNSNPNSPHLGPTLLNASPQDLIMHHAQELKHAINAVSEIKQGSNVEKALNELMRFLATNVNKTAEIQQNTAAVINSSGKRSLSQIEGEDASRKQLKTESSEVSGHPSSPRGRINASPPSLIELARSHSNAQQQTQSSTLNTISGKEDENMSSDSTIKRGPS
ncbi:MAG TPA: hypothetical protein VHA13_00615 [Gammaproteobacteria bacterium]|nr:hypothetical protein [Gammaproteobacteria bacterium]